MRHLVRVAASLFWSELLPSLAGLFLVVQSLLDPPKRSGRLIVIAAVIVLSHSVLRFLRDQTVERQRLLVDPKLRTRLNSLLGSLNQFGSVELFKLDLYLAGWQFGLFKTFPWIVGRRLRRQYSIALVSTVSFLDDRHFLSGGPLSLCSKSRLPQFWCAPTTYETQENCFASVDHPINEALTKRCGALRAVPVTDGLSRSVLGVLVLHVEPASAEKLAGTLAQSLVAQSLNAAAQDLALMLMR